MTLLFANNATGTLAGPITNTATTANLAAGTGALFPNPTSPDYFKLTLTDAATGLLNEIVHVTARSTDTITIVRARENTTAKNWLAGDIAENRWTAGSAAAMIQNVQQSGFFQGTDTSSNANAMTVPTTSAALSAPPAAGQIFFVTKGSLNNTGPVTCLIGTGVTAGTAQNVVYGDGSPMRAGDLPGTVSMWLYNTGTVYQLVGKVVPALESAQWHDGTATGSNGAALVSALTPLPASFSAGIKWRAKLGAAILANATYDFGGGAKPLFNNNTNAAVIGNEGIVGETGDFQYDGTNVLMLNPAPASALAALKILSNLVTFTTSTRFVMNGNSGNSLTVTPWTVGNYTKKSATSNLVIWLRAPTYVADSVSNSPRSIQLTVGVATRKDIAGHNKDAQLVGATGLNAVILAAEVTTGSLAISVSYLNSIGGNWGPVIFCPNGTSTDGGGYYAPGTTASIIIGEYEP